MESKPHIIIEGRFYCDAINRQVFADKHTVADFTYSGAGIKCRFCFTALKLESLNTDDNAKTIR